MAGSMAQALLEAGIITEENVEAVERKLRRKPKKRRQAQAVLDQVKRLRAVCKLEGLTGIQAMDLNVAKLMMQMYGVFPFCYECKRLRRDTKFWSDDEFTTIGCFCEECRKKLGLTMMFMDCSVDTFRERNSLEPLPEGVDFPDLQAQLDEWAKQAKQT